MDIHFREHKPISWMPWFFGIILLTYISIRAITIPMTHDESLTCLWYVPSGVYDIITYRINPPLPNNHILNTLLIKLFTMLFGMKSLVIRFPQLICFIIYYYSSVKLIEKISTSQSVFWMGLLAITCNPYLIDFFSLARGYAMSITFMMAAIYLGALFYENGRRQHLLFSGILAALSVYSNFTILNFYIPFIVILGIRSIIFSIPTSSKRSENSVLRPYVIILASTTAILFSLMICPIIIMMRSNQFAAWGTKGFFENTLLTVAQGTLYHEFLQGTSPKVLAYVFMVLFGLMIVVFILNLMKKGRKAMAEMPVLIFLLLFLSLAWNFFQHYLLNVPFLTGRTALFFYPLFVLNFILLIQEVGNFLGGSIFFYTHSFSLCFVLLMASSLNISHCYEWEYDADNCKVLKWIDEHRNHQPVGLNTTWLVEPSMRFYKTTQKLDWLNLSERHDIPTNDSIYKYYFVFDFEKHQIDSFYHPIITYANGKRFLMERNNSK